jgi:hypothetical protein
MFRKTMALMMAVSAFLAISATAGNDIFNVSKGTGMSPGVAVDVRTAALSSQESVANVAGGWTMDLNDAAASRTLSLTLYQNNDAVFGSGDITISGSTTDVRAGGTLKGNSLTLYIMPSGEPSLYKMDLMVGPGSLTGRYVFSEQANAEKTGSATGSLREASTAMSVTKNEMVTIQVGAGQTNADRPQGPKGSAF